MRLRPDNATRRPSDDYVYEEILRGLPDAVAVLDKSYRITWCNPAITTLLGWSQREVRNSHALSHVVADDMERAIEALTNLWKGRPVPRTRIRLISASGRPIHVAIDALDHSHNPRLDGIILSVRNAESEVRAVRSLEVLESQADRDQLTGLVTRRALHQRLSTITMDSQAQMPARSQVAALFVDLDRFKSVNDIHGHEIGDQVLKVAATRLQRLCDTADIVARSGGDEFVVVCIGTDRAAEALNTAHEICQVLSQPYEVADNRLHLSASVGVASQRIDALDGRALLQQADTALFAAKERGRDGVVEFDHALSLHLAKTQEHRSAVGACLDSHSLQVLYQPILDVAGAMIGIEALARCPIADGLLTPDEFGAAIAGTDLGLQLDQQAFEAACRTSVRLAPRFGSQFWVASNFSAASLAQGDFAETVLDTIHRSGADPASLCIEITETAAFHAGPLSIEALGKLRAAGVRIALDDFGTGYSSLSHLRDLPISSVKIDRSFVQHLGQQGPEHTITEAVVKLAQSLGLGVVAEGVETKAQLDAAHEVGITEVQGWYYAKALRLEQIEELDAVVL